MRIGVVPVHALGGGVYQYSQTMLEALDAWKVDGAPHDFVALTRDLTSRAVTALPLDRWAVHPLLPPSVANDTTARLRKAFGEGPLRETIRFVRRRLAPRVLSTDDIIRRPVITRWLDKLGVELMLYPTHDNLSFETDKPYVQAIHDLQHRLHPEFPEVSANGEWERREYTLKNIVRNATVVLADSEIGKEDILHFYGRYITPDRIRVLPFLGATYLNHAISAAAVAEAKGRFCLPERFLFYPAQFWPHKNHLRIVEALAVIRDEFRLEIPIVFCGSQTGEIRRRTVRTIMTAVERLKLNQSVHVIDYVSDDDMSALYAGATALVMPTFFGPTNIPPIEAAAFGCPVLTSDIRGIREQVGNGAILVDPRSADAIADGIYRLWNDHRLRRAVADNLRARLCSYTSADFRGRLVSILSDAADIAGRSNP